MAQLYLLIRLYTHLESFVKVLCVVLEVNSPKSKLMRNIGSLFYARIRDFGTNAFRVGFFFVCRDGSVYTDEGSSSTSSSIREEKLVK